MAFFKSGKSLFFAVQHKYVIAGLNGFMTIAEMPKKYSDGGRRRIYSSYFGVENPDVYACPATLIARESLLLPHLHGRLLADTENTINSDVFLRRWFPFAGLLGEDFPDGTPADKFDCAIYCNIDKAIEFREKYPDKQVLLFDQYHYSDMSRVPKGIFIVRNKNMLFNIVEKT